MINLAHLCGERPTDLQCLDGSVTRCFAICFHLIYSSFARNLACQFAANSVGITGYFNFSAGLVLFYLDDQMNLVPLMG